MPQAGQQQPVLLLPDGGPDAPIGDLRSLRAGRRQSLIGVAIALLAGAASCNRVCPAPAPSGRPWTTPPILQTADGGLVGQRLPRVVYRGGRFLSQSADLTVTFTQDDRAIVRRVEQFGDTITRTNWWREVVDSYCSKPGDCIGEG